MAGLKEQPPVWGRSGMQRRGRNVVNKSKPRPGGKIPLLTPKLAARSPLPSFIPSLAGLPKICDPGRMALTHGDHGEQKRRSSDPKTIASIGATSSEQVPKPRDPGKPLVQQGWRRPQPCQPR